ncbi:hypothetical protein NE237_022481 [Protea cynaroides]|uniref:Uncharacterized protein n=1 Tax=Protea cynaroides TaxID=273540 RepID=A0A9Q0H9U1_9MAGN|nr:hypothetical protein NE237_022481 [Protea cynaroides]
MTDLNQNRPSQRKTNHHSSNRGLTQSGTPPCIAKLGPGSAAPRSFSIGHTPYTSHVSNLSRSRQTNIRTPSLIPSLSSFPTCKNYSSFSSDLLMAPASDL